MQMSNTNGFPKNRCCGSHISLENVNNVSVFSTFFIRFVRNSVPNISMKVYWFVMIFTKRGALQSVFYLKV
jgi:hypothetical protein